jgi:hypothetical protein
MYAKMETGGYIGFFPIIEEMITMEAVVLYEK